jgi:UDP-N-acetylmuramate--alanine ligase
MSATLASARQVYPGRRLVALFQPHLFSRTRDFAKDFGKALKACDLAIVMDVYPSREKPMPGVTGRLVADAALESGCAEVVYVPEKTKVVGELTRLARPGDVVLTMGAGDVVKFGEEFLSRG